MESESDNGVVRGKSGRTRGAINWSKDNFTALLDVVEDLLPAGKKDLARVYSHFEAWEKEQGCPLHSEATVENCYKVVSCSCLDFSIVRLI